MYKAHETTTNLSTRVPTSAKLQSGSQATKQPDDDTRVFGRDTLNLSGTTSKNLGQPYNGKKKTQKNKMEALKATAEEIECNLGTKAPNLKLKSAITSTNLMKKMLSVQAGQKDIKRPEQCQIDLAFHYTYANNVEGIIEKGLMTKQEREENIVKSAFYHGSIYNDGVYTANNPFAFVHSYGDTGIVLARLCGEAYDTIERVYYTDEIGKIFKSVIIGNKYKPYDHSQIFDEVVLQFGSQVVPLLTYSADAIDPLWHSNSENIKVLYQACDMLLETLNTRWNTKAIGNAIIHKYSQVGFAREAMLFDNPIQHEYLKRTLAFEASALAATNNPQFPAFTSSSQPASMQTATIRTTTLAKANSNGTTNSTHSFIKSLATGASFAKPNTITTSPGLQSLHAHSMTTSATATVAAAPIMIKASTTSHMNLSTSSSNVGKMQSTSPAVKWSSPTIGNKTALSTPQKWIAGKCVSIGSPGFTPPMCRRNTPSKYITFGSPPSDSNVRCGSLVHTHWVGSIVSTRPVPSKTLAGHNQHSSSNTANSTTGTKIATTGVSASVTITATTSNQHLGSTTPPNQSGTRNTWKSNGYQVLYQLVASFFVQRP